MGNKQSDDSTEGIFGKGRGVVIAALWDGSGCLVGEFGEPVSTGFHKEISNSRITTVKMEEQEPRLEMGSDSNFGYEKLVRQVEKFNHEGKERGWEMGYFYQKSVKQSASASWRRRRRRAARVSAATPFCGDRNRNQRPTSTLEQAQTLRLLARSLSLADKVPSTYSAEKKEPGFCLQWNSRSFVCSMWGGR